MKKTKKVFLGGTCNNSTWRDSLTPRLTIDVFNPVVSDWNEEAYQQELHEREMCDYCLYIITPLMTGAYSIAEVVDDSNKRPEKTVFCFLETDDIFCFTDGQIKSLKNVGKMVEGNGAKWCKSIDDVVKYLNR